VEMLRSRFDLPARTGSRPRTSVGIPHIQLDQLPSAGFVEELFDGILRLPGVQPRESRVSKPGVRAFRVPDRLAGNLPDAFIDDHEFCHLHSGGALHLTVPRHLRVLLDSRGWAEQHRTAKAGLIAETIYLVYAPRTTAELDVVLWIINESFQFATAGVARQ
jgi:phospholipase/carboxylesterase